MKKQLQHIRRFFVRTKKYNATAARAAIPASYDDDEDGGNRLSGAFIVVLLLHVVAIVGVFAFARIKDHRKALTPVEPSTQTAAAKIDVPKPPPVAPTTAVATPARETLKTPAPGSGIVHVVKGGETITKIAFAYNVPVNEIVTLNKLKNQDDIRIGTSLTIPETRPTPMAPAIVESKPPTPITPNHKTATATTDKKTPKIYIVKKGDTAAKIARDHGCTYEDLVKLNSIKDPKKIQPGQQLKVPVKNG